MPRKGNASAPSSAAASSTSTSKKGTAAPGAAKATAASSGQPTSGGGGGGRGGRGSRRDRHQEEYFSDDDSLAETGSVLSSASEKLSVHDDEADERTQLELLEEKLKEAIDLTSQKSSHGRTTAFETLCKALATKHLPDFIMGRRMTIMDCVERGLKKGRGGEQQAAAQLIGLVCLQLGSVSDSEAIYKDQKASLLSVIADRSVLSSTRAQCCTTLGVVSFLADNELAELDQVMLALEHVFSRGVAAASAAGDAAPAGAVCPRLCTAALSAWTLLMTLLSPRRIHDLSQTHVPRLVRLLDSTDVELRIGAGEAIAVIYEGARCFDEDFGFDVVEEDEDVVDDDESGVGIRAADVDELCAKLRQLATDSHKYRAKKERKQQRSSFRDILRCVEENEAPELRVKFGAETLDVDTWARKLQYDAFCQLLGSGTNFQLAHNELLRDVFDLGPPLLADQAGGHNNNHRTSKLERHYVNSVAFKARSLARAKNRDKRSAVF